jgi:hypothetical protein
MVELRSTKTGKCKIFAITIMLIIPEMTANDLSRIELEIEYSTAAAPSGDDNVIGMPRSSTERSQDL